MQATLWQRLGATPESVAELCRKWRIVKLEVFGSVLRDDFRPKSDVDVMVVIKPDAHIGLFELLDMKWELEAMFKRKVDLVEKDGIRNPYRRREILRTAKVIYAAGSQTN